MATDTLLEVLHRRFREAFATGESQALGELYSDGATILPPERDPIVGREAILGFWENARRLRDIVFEPSGSEQIGDDVLRETGTLRLHLQGQGPQMRTRITTYLSVWRRVDGDWKLDSSMWRLKSPGAGARQGQARMRNRQGGQVDSGSGRRVAGGGPNEGQGRGNIIGFGPRARLNRADQQAPMIPILD